MKITNRVKVLLISIFLGASLTHAQDKPQAVYGELFGPSNLVGANYEFQITNNAHWKYRIGIGYGFSHTIGGGQWKHLFGIPFGVSYLIGNEHKSLELGIGANAGIFHKRWTYTKYEDVQVDENLSYLKEIGKERITDTNPYKFFYWNAGYRHLSKKGFLFRTGITFGINPDDSEQVLLGSGIIPYASFGYVF